MERLPTRLDGPVLLARGFSLADPDVAIEWPDGELLSSERDRTAPRLAEIADSLPF